MNCFRLVVVLVKSKMTYWKIRFLVNGDIGICPVAGFVVVRGSPFRSQSRIGILSVFRDI